MTSLTSRTGDPMSPTQRAAEAVRRTASRFGFRDGPGSALLLMQRSDNGSWGLPGGYVEIGETVSAAAVREVQEETGVAVALGRGGKA